MLRFYNQGNTTMSIESTIVRTVCYEQPLNEPMRICLRIETLFQELRSQLCDNRDMTLSALITLLKIINVLDRPDIKSKITQTLNQYALSLSQLSRFNQVDSVRLSTVLDKLDTMSHSLHNNNEKVAERLKNNHFLNQLRLQLTSPAGVCAHANSALRLWQHQSKQDKVEQLRQWSAHLQDIDTSAELILGLVRQSTTDEEVIATNGFYQQTLNPSLPCELISLKINQDIETYPEISAGKHRLTIRFMQPNYYQSGHAKQYSGNVPFSLSCCRL